MKGAGIKHLVVCDAAGKVRGIVARNEFDFSLFQPEPLSATAGEPAPLLADLRTRFLKLPELLDVFVNSHAHSEWLTGLTTTVADQTAITIAGISRQRAGSAAGPIRLFRTGQ